MSRFLVDNQLPVALARWLRDQGHVAEHALELDLAQAPDRFLWHYAAALPALTEQLTSGTRLIEVR